MLYQLALCAAILCASAEHERGQDRDALSGSALHSHQSKLTKHEHERKSVSLSHNDDGATELHERGQDQQHEQLTEKQQQHSSHQMETDDEELFDEKRGSRSIGGSDTEELEENKRGSRSIGGGDIAEDTSPNEKDQDDLGSDSIGLYGCVWDSTGAGDVDRMELNCDRLSEGECVSAGNGNKDGRCVWKAKSHLKGSHKETITNAGKDQAMEKKVAGVVFDLDDDTSVAPLGCLWDGSQCEHELCDMEQMVLRCEDLSHSKASCSGDMGVDRGCFWSHGTAKDAMKGAAALKIMGYEVNVVAEFANENKHSASSPKEMDAEEELEEDTLPQMGCLWDQTGCAHDECDKEQMQARCAGFMHSKTSCIGEMGQDARCYWSHGAEDEEFEHFKVENKAAVKVVAEFANSNKHSANSPQEEEEELSDDAETIPQLGCLWDGSGCAHDECDRVQMQARCDNFMHSKTSCIGEMGQDARCFWSHGADEEFEHFKVENKAEVKVVAEFANSNKHSASSPQEKEEELEEDTLPQMGCLWDQTGCAHDECDRVQMQARCDNFMHSKTSCIGEMGQDARCYWSHGADDQVMEESVVNGGFEGTLKDMKVSTMDILLGAAFVITAAFALQRLYKWYADRGYIKLAEQPQDVEPLLMTQV